MPNQKYIKIAQNYYLFLRSKGMVFDKCYLFGSCIRGSNTKDSDIDILLISNCFLYIIEEHIHLLYNITKEYNKLIDIFYISLYKFNKINPNPNNNYFCLHDNKINDIHYPIFPSAYFLSLPTHSTV